MIKGRTKDEAFIVKAYETALAAGDIETVLDLYEIGKQAGITAKGVNAITTLLAQANFIKKEGDTGFYLTPNGEELALRVLEQ